jgi:hypothetical protein
VARTCPQCRAPWDSAALEAKTIQPLSLASNAFQLVRDDLLKAVKVFVQPEPLVQTRLARRRREVQHDSAALQSTAEGAQPENEGEEESTDDSSDWEPSLEVQAPKDNKLKSTSPLPLPASAPKRRKVTDRITPPSNKAGSEDKLPMGCGACPICNRTFSIALLRRHVDACLVSVEVTQATKRPARGPLEGNASTSKPVLDLTDSPCAAFSYLIVWDCHTPMRAL